MEKHESSATAMMYPALSDYFQTVKEHLELIPRERQALLNRIASFIQLRQDAGEPVNLVFICTHNSRRSHLSQVWAATAAACHGLEINTFSGGTEATAFNIRAVHALERAGFRIDKPGGANPHYQVRFSEDGEPMDCFSKVYDDPVNPAENFAAIMTCSDADDNCPFIPGVSLRVPLTYEDPKESDGTDQESDVYDVRCFQIATEMFYLMSQVSE